MTQAQQRSFGVRIAGVNLLLPAGAALEYLATVAVFPLPGAARRVVGLMQLRGQPMVVLDGAMQPMAPAATVCRMPVLVLGGAPEGAALVVEAPPRAVASAAGPVADAVRPECPFRDALGESSRDESGQAWWSVDPRRLFEILAGAR